MRLTIIAKGFPPARGGIETYVFQSVQILAKKFETTVITLSSVKYSKNEIDYFDFSLVRLYSKYSLLGQPLNLGLYASLVKSRPQIIHLHAPNPLAVFFVYCYKKVYSSVKLIITHHADITGRKFIKWFCMPFYQSILKQADQVHVLSHVNSSKSLDINYKSIISKIYCIPIGIKPSDFSIIDLQKKRISDFFYLCCVGRLVSYKGIEFLIRAIGDKTFNYQVHLKILGSGPLYNHLQNLANQLAPGRVHFFKNLDDLQKTAEMMSSHCLVMPSISTSEAFGIVQVEAQSLALPVIRTDLPTGVSDVTIAGLTGWVVKPADIHSLEQSIFEASVKEISRLRGEAGYNRMLEYFSLTAFQTKILSAYAAL